MKNRTKGPFQVAIPAQSVEVFNLSKNRLVGSWIQLHEKPGRIFSMNGHHAIIPINGRVPYNNVTERFFYYAQALLGRINPRFYFDIVKDDASGVEIIKLQSERTYDCKVFPELSALPDGGILSDKESSLVISLLAYQCCHRDCKDNRILAEEYAKRYAALRQSWLSKISDGQRAFDFGDLE